VAERDVPDAGSLLKTAPASRLPSWMQRVGKGVKHLIRPQSRSLPVVTPVTDVARKMPAQRQKSRQVTEQSPAPDRASKSRPAPRLSAEARDIREALGEKTVKGLFAGDLHPKKVLAVFSKLEAANLGHAARAGAMPPMPQVAIPRSGSEAGLPAKLGTPSRSGSSSTVSSASSTASDRSDLSRSSTQTDATSIHSSDGNGAANMPASAHPASPPEARSRETLTKAREGTDGAVSMARHLDPRSRAYTR
jgi:hypothetical protein